LRYITRRYQHYAKLRYFTYIAYSSIAEGEWNVGVASVIKRRKLVRPRKISRRKVSHRTRVSC